MGVELGKEEKGGLRREEEIGGCKGGRFKNRLKNEISNEKAKKKFKE